MAPRSTSAVAAESADPAKTRTAPPKKRSGCCKCTLALFGLVVLAAIVLAALQATHVISLPFIHTQNHSQGSGSSSSSSATNNGGSTNDGAPKTIAPGNNTAVAQQSGPLLADLKNQKVLPFDNHTIWGAHLWGDGAKWVPTLDQYTQSTGYKPAIVGCFVRITSPSVAGNPMGFENLERLEGWIQEAHDRGVWLLLTLEPFFENIVQRDQNVLDLVDDNMIAAIAQFLKGVNNDKGVSVLLRWAHEMNGTWYPWSFRPLKYKETWIRLYKAVTSVTSMTQFIWAPNDAKGYPFGVSDPRMPAHGTPEFAALDDNNNGVFGPGDGGYAPFFPGVEYVDWIGLSLFWYGVSWPFGFNIAPKRDEVVQRLASFYQWLGTLSHKPPLAVIETSAPYYLRDAGHGPTTNVTKSAWWRQLASYFPPTLDQTVQDISTWTGDEAVAPDAMPTGTPFKLICWFEFWKSEDGTERDFTVTHPNDTDTLATWKSDFQNYNVVFAK
ncbi:hypothetical protein RI367_000289 [Sorochytrium milnesiophthora]